MNVELGIFQFAVDLAPVQAFAHAHPIVYWASGLVVGGTLPKLWLGFLTKGLPAATIRAIKFLRSRGLTLAQLKEIDKAFEVVDKTIDAEVEAEEKAEAASKAGVVPESKPPES